MATRIQRHTGFTLAEVLITLGIIGVVASMIIPTLMQNAQDREIISGLKKTFSVLSSAYTMAVQEEGEPDTWGITADIAGRVTILNKIKPYLKILKDCSPDAKRGCFPTDENYKWLTNDDDMVFDNIGRSLILADGSIILGQSVVSATCNSSTFGSTLALKHICGIYLVDVNGFKKPNTMGKDTFLFYLTKYGIVPVGSSAETWMPFTAHCVNAGGISNGQGCAAWVIYNENLDYTKCATELTSGWTGQTHCR